jgi:hypothetical protein
MTREFKKMSSTEARQCSAIVKIGEIPLPETFTLEKLSQRGSCIHLIDHRKSIFFLREPEEFFDRVVQAKREKMREA